MKSVYIFLSYLFSISCLFTQSPTYPPNMGEWVKIFSDEFEADKLDKDVWNLEHNTYSNSGITKRDSSNISLDNGDLKIYIKRVDDMSSPKVKWTCGYAYTKERFGRNVYFEARMKTQKISGVNNAFWLVTRTDLATSYSNRYEIDINEIQYDVLRKQNAAHLAWHDWKTYQYATDASGNPVDNALGAMKYYDSDDYQIWGFWLKDNEFHFYLNGEKIWNGIDHRLHREQWKTGVGKIFPWATQEEQRAYGKYKQDDWDYLGGYTGEMMHVAFSNMIMSANWTPETEDADGSFMSVDWIRVYEPKEEHNKTPKQRINIQDVDVLSGDIIIEGNELKIGKGEIRIPLPNAISLAEDKNEYFSYWLNNPQNSQYRLTLLGEDGEEIGNLSTSVNRQLTLDFLGNRTSSFSVFPHAFYSKGQAVSSEYLTVGRFTSKSGVDKFDGDAWSVSIFNKGEKIPNIEPYFYPNIDETGETSFNNQWMLNSKKRTSGIITDILIENFSEEPMIISNFRFGNNYLSVVSDEVEAPYAEIISSSIIGGGNADTLKVRIRSKYNNHRIGLEENGIVRYVENVPTGDYNLIVSPKETTTYRLVSIEGETKMGYVSSKSMKVFIEANDCLIKYPSFDTYIQENRPDEDFSSSGDFYIKSDRQYVREAFFEFDISELKSNVKDAGVFFYLNNINPVEEISIGIFALDNAFNQPLSWIDRPSWVKRKQLGNFNLKESLSRYYGDDISDYINECIGRGEEKVYLQLVISSGSNDVLAKFYQYNKNKLFVSPKLIYTPTIVNDAKVTTSEILPSFDTFVAERGVGGGAGSGNSENYLWIKNTKAEGWGREAFVCFDLALDTSKDLSAARLKLHLNELASADRYIFALLNGLPENPNITNLVWNKLNSLGDVQEIEIAAIDTTDVGNYIYWDVTDYLISQISDKKNRVTFKIKAVGGSIDALLKFDQGHDNVTKTEYPPILELVYMTGEPIGIEILIKGKKMISIYPNPTKDIIRIVDKDENDIVEIFDSLGQLKIQTDLEIINLGHLRSGVYFVKMSGKCLKLIKN